MTTMDLETATAPETGEVVIGERLGSETQEQFAERISKERGANGGAEMSVSVAEACAALEMRGLLQRQKRDTSERIAPYVQALIGRELPADLRDFYREHILAVGEFRAVWPIWNDHVGWRTPDSLITELLHVQSVPIMGDGCGNLFGLDLASGSRTPAVYFFDHEDGFECPRYAAGSSLASFLLLMGEHDRAFREGWPARWELAIDPEIEKCPRAPAIWFAD